MRDAEYLRQKYNERFRGPSGSWTSEDLKKCRSVAARIKHWTFRGNSSGLSMLDVGCALGYYTKAFFLEGFRSSGLDYSEVAIERARELHPECTFIHADGFNPDPEKKYDLIFCKGFSGANTHDLSFVSDWSNKYINILKPGGKFVFAFTTDYSGKEKGEETVNWTRKEILDYTFLVNAELTGIKNYYRYFILSKIFAEILSILKRKKFKNYFYIIFSKT